MWTFYVYLAFSLLAVLVVAKLRIARPRLTTSYSRGLSLLFSDRRWGTFLLPILVSGMGSSAGFSFLFLHLQDLGASRTLMGFALTISSLSELPTFFFAGAIDLFA